MTRECGVRQEKPQKRWNGHREKWVEQFWERRLPDGPEDWPFAAAPLAMERDAGRAGTPAGTAPCGLKARNLKAQAEASRTSGGLGTGTDNLAKACKAVTTTRLIEPHS